MLAKQPLRLWVLTMADTNKRAMEILITVTGADEAELAAAMTEPDHPDNTVDVLDAIAAVEAAMREPVRVTDELALEALAYFRGYFTKLGDKGDMLYVEALEDALGQGKAHVG